MELTTIEMRGDKIPLLCTLSVLEEIQIEFGSVQKFSEKLMPMIRGKDGKMEPSGALPDIHAICFSLPRFIAEGIEVYNENHKIKMEKMTAKQIFRMCDASLVDVSLALYKELWRSINAPKPQPPVETNQ